jgi:hypothetical protein
MIMMKRKSNFNMIMMTNQRYRVYYALNNKQVTNRQETTIYDKIFHFVTPTEMMKTRLHHRGR